MTLNYLAVECFKFETMHDVVHKFMLLSESKGLLYSKLEVLGDIEVGSKLFVRFRLNANKDLGGILEDLKKDRGIIYKNGEGYRIHLTNGRSSTIQATKMYVSAASAIKREYRGPKHPLWKAQFS